MNELILYIAILVWAFIRYYRMKEDEREETAPVPSPDFAKTDTLLQERIPYYIHLSPNKKQEFVARLREVKNDLEFGEREGFEVTDEVRTLVCASITQLTMGFNEPQIPMLKGVVLFPDIFYSKLLDKMVKGLAMGTGIVFMSWKHFVEGYRDSADTYNLGLHEFAHMLHMEAQEQGIGFDERLNSYYEEWQEIGYPVFMRIKSGEEDFLRAYGGENQVEFFSVCVENFFEVPKQFEQELPELYYHLCYLLKQNPLNIAEDYAFEMEDIKAANERVKEDIPLYSVIRTRNERVFWLISNKIRGLYWLITFILILNLPQQAQPVFWRMLLISLIIFMLIRWKYYEDHKAIVNKEYLLHLTFKLTPMVAFLVVIYKLATG